MASGMERKSGEGSASSKDIWHLLASTTTPKEKDSEPQEATTTAAATTPRSAVSDEKDTFTLLVGSKGAGKSSLTATFRNSTKTEEIKPTTALEYVFVRLKGTGKPVVAHMWELATLRCIPEMMRVPLAPERVLQSTLVVVLDLSAPGDVVPFLVKWLITLHHVVHDLLAHKEKHGSRGDRAAIDRLRSEAMARYGAAHPDKDEVCPLPLPLLILGNKYDTFRDEDSVKRKGITQALRSLAHQYGGTLLFTSTKEKACVSQFRSLMKNFAFRIDTSAASGNGKASKDVDPTHALFVPAGSDFFDDIGVPKTARKLTSVKEDPDERARQWKKIATEYYPPSGNVRDDWPPEAPGDGRLEDDGKDISRGSFPEPSIDRARQRKLEDLRRYRDTRRKQQLDKPT